jgi:hypothetical protein
MVDSTENDLTVVFVVAKFKNNDSFSISILKILRTVTLER